MDPEENKYETLQMMEDTLQMRPNDISYHHRSLNKQITINTKLTQQSTINDDSKLPYDNNYRSKLKYHCKSLIVTNPRLYSLYLLSSATWPQILLLLDMYTDFIVVKDLYNSALSSKKDIDHIVDESNSIILFMLSCLFLFFPFVMVWAVSLRFIHRFVTQQPQERTSCNKLLFNTFLIMYLFPPIGCLLISLVEVYWVLHDILKGICYFFIGKILILNTNEEIKAIKHFRKIIELFGESIPQIILQLYIWQSDANYVEFNSLMLSVAVSLFSFSINFYTLYDQSKYHGMSMAEYALSLLQLSVIPVIKFIPRLPAVKKGEIDEYNLSQFTIDKESLGPIINALSNVKCKLKYVKLSVDSISDLDTSSLSMLAQFFLQKNIKCTIINTGNSAVLLDLFRKLDKDNKGYIEFSQFQTLLAATTVVKDEVLQQILFRRLAIRRLKKYERDRVYFDDFHSSIIVQSKEYDCTSIQYPLHFAINHVFNIYQKSDFRKLHINHGIYENLLIEFDRKCHSLHNKNTYGWCKFLHRLINLVHFATSLSVTDILFDNNNEHILSKILSTLNKIKQGVNDNITQLIEGFIWHSLQILLEKTCSWDQLSIDDSFLKTCVTENITLFACLVHYSLFKDDSKAVVFRNCFTYASLSNVSVEEAFNISVEKGWYNTIELLLDDMIKISQMNSIKSWLFLIEKILSSPNIDVKILQKILINSKNNHHVATIHDNIHYILELILNCRADKGSTNLRENVRQAVMVQSLRFDQNIDEKIAEYMKVLLEFVEMLTVYDATSCIQTVTTVSPLIRAVMYDDIESIEAILKNINNKETYTSVMDHKYEYESNKNIFLISLDKVKYKSASYLIRNHGVHMKTSFKNMSDYQYLLIQLFKDYKYFYKKNDEELVCKYIKEIIECLTKLKLVKSIHGSKYEIAQHLREIKKNYNKAFYKYNITETTLNTLCDIFVERRKTNKWSETSMQKVVSDRNLKKILLLGTSNAGKTTICKQLRRIYSENSTRELNLKYGSTNDLKRSIYDNVRWQMIEIVRLCERLGYQLDEDAKQSGSYLDTLRTDFVFNKQVAYHIQRLWDNVFIKLAFTQKDNLSIVDSAEHFFNSLDRMSQTNYKPTMEDTLLVRVPTTGTIRSTIIVDSMTYHLYDTGGERAERNKWIHCMENVSVMLYVADLSCFDQGLYEIHTQNAMHETIYVWSDLLNCRFLRLSTIVLFLNKCDLFRNKLEQKGKDLRISFGHYDGNNSYDDAIEYIKNVFLKLDTKHNRTIYPHVTCAIDENSIIRVFNQVHEELIAEYEKRYNFLV
eukprot:215111_1